MKVHLQTGGKEEILVDLLTQIRNRYYISNFSQSIKPLWAKRKYNAENDKYINGIHYV